MAKKLLLASALLAASLNASAQIPTLGLTRHYPFTGNANDNSANTQNGVVNGATLTTDRFGNQNSAYNFDGNTSTYISIPATGLNTNEFSYSVWASINAYPASGDRSWILSIGSLTGTSNFEQLLNFNNAYGATTVSNGWIGSGYNNATPNVNICQGTLSPLNTWYHLTFTRSTTEAKFYVNGTLVNTTALSATNTPNYGTGTLEANIGRRRSATNPFNGKIDDLRIYNRALDITEVAALYNETSATLGIDSETYSTLNVYPNPTKGLITIDFNNNPEFSGGTIKIVNMLGQTVLAQTTNQQQTRINLSNNETGVYFVHVFDNNNNAICIKKIILQ